MPNLSEAAAYQFRFTRAELQRWAAVRFALIDGQPRAELCSLVDHALAEARREHHAAERRLFDVFDIITSDALEAGAVLGPADHRLVLHHRAAFHDDIALRVTEPDHRALHQRISEQLRQAAAAIVTKPALRRARL